MREQFIKKDSTKSSIGFDYYENKIPVTFTPSKSGRFTVDIYDYIENPSQFSDMITALELMEQDDEMVINLQSGGGCLSTTDTILHALRKTKGTVHFVATGFNASAATILLLEAQTFELSEDFSALIHCGSLSDRGTLSEMRQSTSFHIKKMENVIRNAYVGFMTDQEIQDMLNGKDLLLDATEWCARHEQRNKWMEDEVAKFGKKALDALKPPKKPRTKKVTGNVPPPQYDPATVAFKGLETGFNEDYLAPPKV